ncbi:isopenicillin N synthase family dioxygenase [Nocardia goodfellowii]|uniref:Isopenicillin N synthase-like dioxygenase n=1 Tax=Nocardia goodfellowii TaxID=882446 RepID=A0ABS4QF73_9NOCA|nr:isopenicillin N synthase family oxygenase [Nocardia goodfellowii]MBP2190335.1 isopenicillin N synthase-like dioxygenase [Nocardia goodfellowii]
MNTDIDSPAPITIVDGYVPVIDLSSMHTVSGHAAIAQAIGTACATSGFFVIVGHDVKRELIDRMYATTLEFFQLPRAEKDSVLATAETGGLRYQAGSAAKSIGRDAPTDLCEIFSCNVLGDRRPEYREQFGDEPLPWTRSNRWPRTPTDFRQTWLDYTDAMERLAANLMELFAVALGLDHEFFADKIDQHISTIVANYYYPQTVAPLPGQLRKGEHTDWGSLTILYQDDIGGLQVRHGDRWREVPFVPGSFVINIGDMMAFWTGGRWVSTMHRVGNPAHGDSPARVSIPFFHLPNFDARIEPLSALRSAAGPATTTPGQWYREKMAAIYS